MGTNDKLLDKKIKRRTFLKMMAATGATAAAATACERAQVRAAEFEPVEDGWVPDGTPRELVRGTWHPAGCAGCTSWCAKEAFVVDGRIIKIRPNRHSKVHPGASCTRAQLAIQQLYDPDRIKQPMRRTNPEKGRDIDPGWEPISWDEALGELADKIVELRENREPHKFATLRGRYTNVNGIIHGNLARVIGSPNNISHSSICAEAEKFGPYYTQGFWNYRDYDMANADYALCWGVDPVCSFRQVSQYTSIFGKSLERGMKIATVDPKYSNTAAKSYAWLPVIPGEDDALALAMAHEILATGGWSREFVGEFTDGQNRFVAGEEVDPDTFSEEHTFGVVQWWNIELKDRTPDWAAPICGVEASLIRQVVADMVAAAPRVLVIMGGGNNMQTRGGYSSIAVHALAGLIGSIDLEGGVLTRRSAAGLGFAGSGDYQDAVAREFNGVQKIDQRGYLDLPALKEGKSGGGVVSNRVADAILTADPYRPKVILSYWNNFNFSSPETKRWDKALKQVEFFAHAVTHYSEMSHFADLLLPATFHLGEQRSSLQMVGNAHTQLWYGERLIDPVYDCKNPETEVMWLLGEKLAERGFTNWREYLRNAFRDPETGAEPSDEREFELFVFKNMLQSIWDPDAYAEAGNHGTQFNGWEDFVEAGLWTSDDYNFRGLWSNMPTETGKFEFYSQTLKKALQEHADKHNTDIDGVVRAANYPDAVGERAFVAHYEQAYKHGEQDRYPFDFIDAKAMLNREGRSANCSWYQEFKDVDQGDVKWGDCIKMHPADAAELGLEDGETVRVVSTVGEITTTLKLWPALRPGTVQKTFGQGHYAFGQNAAESFGDYGNLQPRGGNNNDIMPADYERLSGSTAFYGSFRVRVERA